MAAFLILLAILVPYLGEGKDLGCHGHTFVIQEENLLDYLKHRLGTLSEKEKEEFQNAFKMRMLEASKNPPPVKELLETEEYQITYFDPTISLEKDITDHQGAVILKKGLLFNPLSRFSLEQDLLFFDGSNARHVEWAKKQKSNAKWILVKGSPLSLEDRENRPVYFDQGGFLINKLGLQNIPTKVSQDGLKLKIEKIPVGRSDES